MPRAIAMSGRRFEIHRDEDETGVSGTGHVADGIQFDDGKVSVRWRTKTASTTQFDSIGDLEKVHGHGGKTRIVFIDATTRTLDLSPDDVHGPSTGAPPHPRHLPTPRWPLGANMSDATKKRRVERAEKRKARQRTRAATKGTPRIHVRAELGVGGHLHVRHTMSDKDGERIDLIFELADLASDDAPVWNQIACVGAFRGHPSGPFELTPSVFSEIVQNWEDSGRKPIPIDYEHASEAEATSGNIPRIGAPAQGWINRLENRGTGGLWGLVEWLPQARAQIRAKQYKFFSPAIRFASRDKKSGRPIGARLTSGALTNQPFLDALPAIAASDKPGASKMAYAFSTHEYMPKLRACMRLPETATCDEMFEQVDRLRDHFTKCGGNARAMVDGVNLADYLPAMRDAVGATMSATWDQVFDAVEDMIDAAVDVHEISKHDAPGGPDAKLDDGGSGDADAMTANNKKTLDAATAIESDKHGDTPMSDEKNALTLKDNEITTLKLTVRERDTELETLRTENKTLKDAESKRADTDVEREVDEAIVLYAKTKGIVDADKPELVTLLKAAPASFRKLYPPVKPDQRHLLLSAKTTVEVGKNVTDQRTGGGPGSLQLSDTDVMLLAKESLMQTTKRLMKDKKLSLEDAQDQAVKLHRDLATVA